MSFQERSIFGRIFLCLYPGTWSLSKSLYDPNVDTYEFHNPVLFHSWRQDIATRVWEPLNTKTTNETCCRGSKEEEKGEGKPDSHPPQSRLRKVATSALKIDWSANIWKAKTPHYATSGQVLLITCGGGADDSPFSQVHSGRYPFLGRSRWCPNGLV